MGSKNTTTSTQSSTNASGPSGWMKTAGQTLNDFGASQLNKPYQAYSGSGVAGLTGNQQQAISLAQQTPWTPYMTAANDQFGAASGMKWDADTAKSYINPYTAAALDPVAQKMAEQFGMQNRATADASVANGAFGGTRQGLLKAYNQGQQGRAIGDMYSQGFQRAYDTGLGQFNTDRNTKMQLGQQYSGLGALAGTLQGQQIGNLMQTGGAEQATNQNQATWDYNQFLEQRDWPYQQAERYKSLISGLPYESFGTSNSTSTQTQPGPSKWGMIAGLAGTLGGAALGNPALGSMLGSAAGGAAGGSGGTFGGMSLPTMGSGAGGGMFGGAYALSDRRLKTNIKRVGKLDNGLPVYRYRYKDDNQIHIGVMAQDVAKVDRDAVKKVDGKHMAVNYMKATAPTFGALAA